MLNIANHHGNANQNHNEISPYMCQDVSVGEDVEKREHSSTVGGNINWCSHYWKKSMKVHQKIKNKTTI